MSSYSPYPIPPFDPSTGIENPYYPKFACSECCESNSHHFYFEEGTSEETKNNILTFWRNNRAFHGVTRCPCCGNVTKTYTTASYDRPQFYMKIK